ncbi:hypothetical protein CEXT_719961 [Caerostris extrusa]|uniref:Uncharacterized protein n=1 Tax=Caerostris extrusa TaxID=172846 RepID=A0AAV4VG71_CAEEX|nr:hypothetical protein CEXT_719961 [Caerostris extrusa]
MQETKRVKSMTTVPCNLELLCPFSSYLAKGYVLLFKYEIGVILFKYIWDSMCIANSGLRIQPISSILKRKCGWSSMPSNKLILENFWEDLPVRIREFWGFLHRDFLGFLGFCTEV